eukprot:CAMPEP_0113481630 /NCGR_PEP_ID=MMETSP0014_2-20120614/22507_1 /TAXON_ID=2857 /ORGANISM="Nitzschia sp." /LENGTH=502 /DNA_ID=CAMNT_0000375131 /DNA_START=732 /DNA_END=2240 /DNA_ORIENTATION=- /assembly_acc=CAM_ASM_000159
MEPTPEQAAEGGILVKVLAAVLERLVKSNNVLARTDPGQVTKFHALKAPGICVEQYLERIHKYACCSNECFILALIYIDRLIQRNNFLLTELNVHRVVITAILLAAKFFDDAYYNNAYYSKVGGVLVSEMNGLEVDFLFRINFSLHVQPDVFHKYKAELVAHAIHAGLSTTSPQFAPSPVIQPAPTLPQIAEALETLVNNAAPAMEQVGGVVVGQTANANQLLQMTQQQQQFIPMAGAPIEQHFAGGGGLPQVTPSPSEQHQVGYSSMSIPLQQHFSQQQAVAQQQQEYLQQQILQASIPNNVNANDINQQLQIVQQQQLQQQALYMPNAAPGGQVVSDASAPLQELIHHHYQPTRQQQQQQQQENMMRQRSNSLPPVPTEHPSIESRCSDYSRNLPYHSAPVASNNLALPVVNVVDQDQYQAVMNQLFPIQPTLVHHNHTAAELNAQQQQQISANNSNDGTGSSASSAAAALAHHQHHAMNHPYAGSNSTAGNLGSVMAYQ